MKTLISVFKNKEIMSRIFFTLMILFIFRLGAAITIPGVSLSDDLANEMNTTSALSLINLLGGGALTNVSIFALGVSPYITSSIIIQLLSSDVLPALSELKRQGEQGRRKMEMATRYLTLLLGAVQAYGIIMMMSNQGLITIEDTSFWNYVYIVAIMLAGGMIVMYLGDQITSKGIGNGISVIIFAGIVVSFPQQIQLAFQQWIGSWFGNTEASNYILQGVFQFSVYILAFLLIIAFVVFIELAKRKIPVQNAGKGGGHNPRMSQASFLPIKVNASGVIPVIFASAILMVPSIIASFMGVTEENTSWLTIFNISAWNPMPGVNGTTWYMCWGLILYIILILLFSFFYANMQINPAQLAEHFQKNGSYIPGIRPGNETERYVKKVVNRVTCIGAIALAFIAALPNVLTLTGVFGENSSLAIGGTGLIIVVGVALEVSNQISGLLAGKSYEEVVASAGRRGF